MAGTSRQSFVIWCATPIRVGKQRQTPNRSTRAPVDCHRGLVERRNTDLLLHRSDGFSNLALMKMNRCRLTRPRPFLTRRVRPGANISESEHFRGGQPRTVEECPLYSLYFPIFSNMQENTVPAEGFDEGAADSNHFAFLIGGSGTTTRRAPGRISNRAVGGPKTHGLPSR